MTKAEQNKLRYTYFKMLIEARRTGDGSPLFEHIADRCVWGGWYGKEEVVEGLMDINVNYKHESTLVQLDEKPDPVRGVDENGRRIGISLWYEAGEICMYDITIHNELLFRLDLDDEGRITAFYGTLPFFFSFHEIPQ